MAAEVDHQSARDLVADPVLQREDIGDMHVEPIRPERGVAIDVDQLHRHADRLVRALNGPFKHRADCQLAPGGNRIPRNGEFAHGARRPHQHAANVAQPRDERVRHGHAEVLILIVADGMERQHGNGGHVLRRVCRWMPRDPHDTDNGGERHDRDGDREPAPARGLRLRDFVLNLANFSDESVATPRNGLDHVLVVVAQQLAKSENVLRQRRLFDKRPRPDRFHQFALFDQRAVPQQEVVERLRSLWGEWDGVNLAIEKSFASIESKCAKSICDSGHGRG